MSGRPPWYNQQGSLKEPFIVGIAGGTSSGKTTVCQFVFYLLLIIIKTFIFIYIINSIKINKKNNKKINI